MFKYTAGFIGAGNMGGALAANVCDKVGKDNVAVVCSCDESTAKAAQKLGCNSSCIQEICSQAQYIFLGIKPQNLYSVSGEICDAMCGKESIIVSMLAGVELSTLCKVFNTDRIIRIMPNVACSVGEGMTLVCCAEGVTDDRLKELCDIISLSGKTDIIAEKNMDAASALAGCGPAFAFQFIEALADGAVKCGLPRAKAYEYAQQMLLGSAKLAMETGKHPAQLKDSVCSPGGSTIDGVAALEAGGMRSAVINAVFSSYEKTKLLGK